MTRSWDVSGWGDLSEGEAGWHDVERGAEPAQEDVDPNEYGSMTIHYTDTETGDDIYFTIHPPYDDWTDVEDLIDYYLEGYGIEE
jgi:hypothetical protein